LLPAQVHANGPEPVTEEAVPLEQRLAVGATVKIPPLEVPQVPLTAGSGIGVTETETAGFRLPAASLKAPAGIVRV
jgi:hypothetical protein